MLFPKQIAHIVQSINVKLIDESLNITDLLYDSRQLTETDPKKTLFFAINTEHDNGHKYIPTLYQSGVRNFIITEDCELYKTYSANFYQVENAIYAIQMLAANHRQHFNIPVIGITGSNGKTIVKEWLSQILSMDQNLTANPNSYNSQIGVAISVWQLKDIHTLAIFEAGISQPGEMEKLENIIRPTIGILTNIGEAHNLYFKNNQEKLEEKLKLFEHAEKIIYCCDNMLIESELQQSRYQHLEHISWGKNSIARYRIRDIKTHQKETEIYLTNEEQAIIIPFIDAASIENAMHIIVYLLYNKNSIASINQKMSQLSPIRMRMEIKEGVNQSIVLNDTYSLDINSLQIALTYLKTQTQLKKKTLIISDFEQTKLENIDYQTIASILRQNNITKLVIVGREMQKYFSLFQIKEQYYFSTTEELIRNIDHLAINQEAILVKGARSFQFEKVVDALQNRRQQTILQVELASIINNLNYYKSQLKPETKVTAMVKAMCYGLGDAELVNELAYHHIDYLAVAYTDEGITLRKRNIRTPIIVLGAEAANFQVMIQNNLEPEIFSIHYLKQLEKDLSIYPTKRGFPIHLKIDTGMHRLGFNETDIPEVISIINNNPQLRLASVFSHLASAEDPKEKSFTLGQIALFDRVCKRISEEIHTPFLRHILNSAGIIYYRDYQYDMVRLGLGLYGYSDCEEVQKHLSNTVTLRSIITQVKEIAKGESIGYNRTFRCERDMRIAVVPIGYADGLPRELSNGVGCMIVHGHSCPIVGKICMDMCMIDVTDAGDVQEEDDVIIYGANNRIDSIAKSIHKTPYELLTSISKRVQRIYIRD